MSKKEKIGTTSLNEKTLFTVTNDSNHILEERNWAFWEKLREKPEYLKLCEDIKFHDSSLVSPRWTVENMEVFLEKSRKAKELFGIDQIVDPRKSQKELQPDIIHLFGVAPVPIKAISALNSDSDMKNRFIEDNRYITLKVDITAKDNVLVPLFKEYVEYFRQEYLKANSPATRDHSSKQRGYFKIWRKRKRKTPFSIIAKEEGISEDTAKKRYYRAYKLIMGHPYNPDNKLKNKIFKSELMKTCSNCTDETCLESLKKNPDNWIPCPDLVYFINEDQRPLKESLRTSNNLLYSGVSDSMDD
jgi:hypothetical protein